MKKYTSIFASLAIAGAMILGAGAVSAALPEQEAELSSKADSLAYPIAELGGCKDKADCKAFCSKGENMQACVAYAEKSGLLQGEHLRLSKIVAEKIAKKETPGGCSTKDSCEEYCQGNVEHIDQCVAFAEELGVVPQEELAQAKMIANALRKGAKMPGACKTKDSCEKYCSLGSHIDECLSFAEASGILSSDRLAEARKVAPFLKNGETPGKCQTKDECETYCREESHAEECLGFAEKAGFISKEEAEIARKVGGSGPGGCRGKEECMAYCNQDEHAKECADFAREKGLLTEKQKEDIDTGVDRLKEGLEKLPPEAKDEVVACLENSIGKEKFARILAKTDVPTQAIGGKIEACFGKVAEIMKAKMMKKGIEGMKIPAGGAPGGNMPSKEEIMKNLPDNIPDEMRGEIEKNIENGGGIMPPPPTSMPPVSGEMLPPAGFGAPDCSMFASVPSCDYVPEPGRDFCKKCKGQ